MTLMTDPLVTIRGLEVVFARSRSAAGGMSKVAAVAGVDLDINRGETLCLVGESGSGKTTTARAIGRLVVPTAGSIRFDELDIARIRGSRLRGFRRRVQFVFQDPFESLNPRQRVGDIVAEPLVVHRVLKNGYEVQARVTRSLEECGLIPGTEYSRRYPHELSGGQRQRVCIATATILEPDLLIADEPVSMLDVSVRAGIIRLLLNLRKAHQMTLLFVTHDLSLAWAIGDRVAVMYAGRLMEVGSAEQVITEPKHPYTSALVTAIPEADPDLPLRPMTLVGEGASSAAATGCCFRLRCPYAQEACAAEVPPLADADEGHLTACIRHREISDELPRIAMGSAQRLSPASEVDDSDPIRARDTTTA
jgi:oligopeptide/dipeptide ABC transporter ATP-binding protein